MYEYHEVEQNNGYFGLRKVGGVGGQNAFWMPFLTLRLDTSADPSLLISPVYWNCVATFPLV